MRLPKSSWRMRPDDHGRQRAPNSGDHGTDTRHGRRRRRDNAAPRGTGWRRRGFMAEHIPNAELCVFGMRTRQAGRAGRRVDRADRRVPEGVVATLFFSPSTLALSTVSVDRDLRRRAAPRHHPSRGRCSRARTGSSWSGRPVVRCEHGAPIAPPVPGATPPPIRHQEASSNPRTRLTGSRSPAGGRTSPRIPRLPMMGLDPRDGLGRASRARRARPRWTTLRPRRPPRVNRASDHLRAREALRPSCLSRDLPSRARYPAGVPALRAAQLGQHGFHGDPADRLIYATARDHGCPLVRR